MTSRILCSILLLLCLACGTETVVQEEIVRPVRYEIVGQAQSATVRRFSGTAHAGTETRLSFRVSGIVKEVPLKSGQRVKKGDLIAVLDDADVRLQVEQAKSAEVNARSNMDTAKANLNRVKGLYENNNVALSEYEAAKNQFAAARSSYDSSRKSTRLQESQMKYFKLHAPMDGIIGSIQVERNENVSAGQQIAELNSEGDMEIRVGLPEAWISRAKTGDPATVTFTALPDKTFEGTVSEVSYAIDQGNQTYPVTITLAETSVDVRPGMVAEAALDLREEVGGDGLIVPAVAVAEDAGGQYVYLVTPAEAGMGTVARRPVEVGRLTNSGFEIISGLEAGDMVVTAGVNNIRDGLKVKLFQ